MKGPGGFCAFSEVGEPGKLQMMGGDIMGACAKLFGSIGPFGGGVTIFPVFLYQVLAMIEGGLTHRSAKKHSYPTLHPKCIVLRWSLES